MHAVGSIPNDTLKFPLISGMAYVATAVMLQKKSEPSKQE